MAVKANALGDYLRARRQQVRPEDVGLVPGARRRVTGLRREELAMLAGSAPRTTCDVAGAPQKNPTPRVVEARARALRLDAKATLYLHQLATHTGRDTSELEAGAYALAEVIDEF